MALTKILQEGIKDGEIVNADINQSAAIARTKLANVDLIDDTSPQLGGNLQTNSNNILLPDSDGSSNILVVGTNNDLQISHRNNVSQLRGTTGNDIKIISAANFSIQHADTDGANPENMVVATGDGAVELYWNGTKKFETLNTGVRIPDDMSYQVGTGADLQIFHNQADNFIRTLNGKIYIDGIGGEQMITAIPDGEVQLYYDGTIKFATQASGIDVYGSSAVDTQVRLKDNSNNIKGYLYAGTGNSIWLLDGQAHGILKGVKDGEVELFHNNLKKLETMSTGVNITGSLGIGNTAPTDLNSGANHIVIGNGTESAAGMTIYTSTTGTGNIYFADGTSSSDPFAGYIQYAHAQNKMIFGPGAGATGTEMVLDSAGRLGIGGTPTAKLYVEQSAASAYVINNNTETNSSYTAYALQTPTQNFQIWINGPNNSGYGGANGCTFWETANTGFNFFSNNTHDAKIDTSGLRLPSGKGIHFADYATSGNPSSNLLDDYEEGTFSPNSSEGMGTVYHGSYTKIGRVVHVTFYVNAPTSTSTNAFVINNLPFTLIGSSHYAIGSCYTQLTSTTYVFLQANQNSTQLNVLKNVGDGVTFANLSGGYVLGSITYMAS